MPRTKLQVGTPKCRLCGRPIPVKMGKGRVREIHTACGQAESALKRLVRFTSQEVVWADHDHQKKFKGDMMAILNQNCDKRTTIFNPAGEFDNRVELLEVLYADNDADLKLFDFDKNPEQ